MRIVAPYLMLLAALCAFSGCAGHQDRVGLMRQGLADTNTAYNAEIAKNEALSRTVERYHAQVEAIKYAHKAEANGRNR